MYLPISLSSHIANLDVSALDVPQISTFRSYAIQPDYYIYYLSDDRCSRFTRIFHVPVSTFLRFPLSPEFQGEPVHECSSYELGQSSP